MGWLRFAGSLKLEVSFAEYSLFYRALLQKRLIILRSLLIVATPYAHSFYTSGLHACSLSSRCFWMLKTSNQTVLKMMQHFDMSHSYVCHGSFICVPWPLNQTSLENDATSSSPCCKVFITTFITSWRCFWMLKTSNLTVFKMMQRLKTSPCSLPLEDVSGC